MLNYPTHELVSVSFGIKILIQCWIVRFIFVPLARFNIAFDFQFPAPKGLAAYDSILNQSFN